MGRLPDDLAAMTGAGGGRFPHVRVFAEVDSTNTLLLEEAAAGAGDGVVVVADHQRAGRGRLGRSWDAEAGSSLLVSLLVRPRFSPEGVPLLPLAAAVDMCDAVAEVCGADVALKWPNDLLLRGRKLGGVLAETRQAGAAAGAVVIGIGVNVRHGALPAGVSESAVSLEDAGFDVARAELLHVFIERFGARCDVFDADFPVARDRLVAELTERCDTIGTHVRVRVHTTGATVAVGEATGIGPRGELLVRRHDGSVRAVDHGEVERLRPA